MLVCNPLLVYAIEVFIHQSISAATILQPRLVLPSTLAPYSSRRHKPHYNAMDPSIHSIIPTLCTITQYHLTCWTNTWAPCTSHVPRCPDAKISFNVDTYRRHAWRTRLSRSIISIIVQNSRLLPSIGFLSWVLYGWGFMLAPVEQCKECDIWTATSQVISKVKLSVTLVFMESMYFDWKEDIETAARVFLAESCHQDLNRSFEKNIFGLITMYLYNLTLQKSSAITVCSWCVEKDAHVLPSFSMVLFGIRGKYLRLRVHLIRLYILWCSTPSMETFRRLKFKK